MAKPWQTKKLGEICTVIAGQSPEGKFYNKNGIGLPFYQGKKDFGDKFIEEATTWTTQVTKEAEAGDILMSVRAPVGPTNFATQKICIGRGLAAIRGGEKIDREFLFYFFQKFENEIVSNKGAVFDSINKTQIENIEIAVPEIEEQKRIVGILDEVFDGIVKAKEAAEKNLKNAREVFESYLQSVFDHSKQNWKSEGLGKLSKINYGYTEKASFEEIGPKFLRITDIQDGSVDWNSVPYCKISNIDLPKYILQNGDIVFARTGATTGKSFLINNSPPSIFASYLIRLKIQDLTIILPQFLYLFFQTKTYWDKIQIGVSGSAQGGFNASKLSEFQIPLPPLSEQKSIVAKLDALSTETKKLEEIYKQKLTHLEELKKSILKKAFNGEL